MDLPFDLWHLAFVNLVQRRAPPNFQWMRETKMKQPDIEELPGFEELFQKTIEAMPIEKRLAGLAPEQVVLALPLELLRALPDEYLRSLPVEIQEQVRKRLQEAAH